jgi:hypothetical protein
MSQYLPWLNEGGLVLAMIGGLILFFWRPPSPSLGPTTPVGDGTAADAARDAERQRIFFLLTARLGLGLIIVGFALQVVANFPYLQIGTYPAQQLDLHDCPTASGLT